MGALCGSAFNIKDIGRLVWTFGGLKEDIVRNCRERTWGFLWRLVLHNLRRLYRRRRTLHHRQLNRLRLHRLRLIMGLTK